MYVGFIINEVALFQNLNIFAHYFDTIKLTFHSHIGRKFQLLKNTLNYRKKK